MIGLSDLAGLWRRAWLSAPAVEDSSTRVYWAQAGADYVDLRIPAERPSLAGARALADLRPDMLALLMQAEGFAGQVALEDGICTWSREIDWHGARALPDAGKLAWDSAGGLLEVGVHAEYRELWMPVPTADPSARRYRAGEALAMVVDDGSWFQIGIGVPDRPSSESLRRALGTGAASRADLERHFSSEYARGRWAGSDGIAELSTNPLRERRAVLRREAGRMIWLAENFDGQRREVALEPV